MPLTPSMDGWAWRSVLVTGGAGFIGANLVRRLLELGAHVRVADNFGRVGARNLAELAGDIELTRVDLLNRVGCFDACVGMNTVFHLASNVGNIDHYRERPGDVLLQNVAIDANVLDAARTAGVERYFYASSAHVYPRALQSRPDAPPLREEQALPADPPVSYGWAKLVGEQAVEGLATQGDLRAAVLRLMNPYGPYQDIDPERASVIPALVRRAIEAAPGSALVLRTSGEETRAFCYVDDAVDAMLLAVERLDERDVVGPLNVGGDGPVSILEVARTVAEVSGKALRVDAGVPNGLIAGQTIDCTRALEELGWQPQLALRDGIERTFAFVERELSAQSGARWAS